MRDVLDHLERLTRDDRDSLTEQMARGMIKDMEEYRYIAGRISALDSVLNAITDIKQQVEKDE